MNIQRIISNLPSTLDPDTLYIVYKGNTIDLVATDSVGNTLYKVDKLTSTQLPNLLTDNISKTLASKDKGIVIPIDFNPISSGSISPDAYNVLNIIYGNSTLPTITYVYPFSYLDNSYPDNTFLDFINKLKYSGAITCGYIDASEKTLNDIDTLISKWKSLYGIDAIYIDKVPTSIVSDAFNNLLFYHRLNGIKFIMLTLEEPNTQNLSFVDSYIDMHLFKGTSTDITINYPANKSAFIITTSDNRIDLHSLFDVIVKTSFSYVYNNNTTNNLVYHVYLLNNYNNTSNQMSYYRTSNVMQNISNIGYYISNSLSMNSSAFYFSPIQLVNSQIINKVSFDVSSTSTSPSPSLYVGVFSSLYNNIIPANLLLQANTNNIQSNINNLTFSNSKFMHRGIPYFVGFKLTAGSVYLNRYISQLNIGRISSILLIGGYQSSDTLSAYTPPTSNSSFTLTEYNVLVYLGG
ncbi:MAG: hypothetical protein QXW35_03570 [Candidatus Aenigmatarchaeota archaeon]